jgi:hypothetical protein
VSLPGLVERLGERPDGVLFLREGAVPSVRSGERLLPAADTALDRRGFEELRDLLLRDAAPAASGDGPADAYLLSAGTLGRLRIEPVKWDGGELLLVRVVPGAAADPGWPEAALESALAAPGAIALLVAPGRGALAAAFAAACRRIVASELGPVVALARRWDEPTPPAGVVLLSTLRPRQRAEAAALVERLDPAVVAVEDAACRPALIAALRAVRGGARALIGICAPTAAEAGDRILAGAGGAPPTGWAEALGTGLAAVLSAEGDARAVEPGVRAALLAGDAGPLAAALR